MEEKPIECTSCKRKGSIIYKEMGNGQVNSMKVCSECPILRKKMGTSSEELALSPSEEPLTHGCAQCHTTSQALLMGEPVGCSNCYSAFEETVVQGLVQSGAMPIQEGSNLMQKDLSLHLGKCPEIQEIDMNISTKLESLNIALSEALTLEHYERAANIRDQIKTLMDLTNGNG